MTAAIAGSNNGNWRIASVVYVLHESKMNTQSRQAYAISESTDEKRRPCQCIAAYENPPRHILPRNKFYRAPPSSAAAPANLITCECHRPLPPAMPRGQAWC